MQAKADRPKRTTSELRLRRLRLGLNAEALVPETGFNIWKIFRIERDPQVARLCDVLALDAALRKRERAGNPGYEAALASAVEGGR